MARNQIMQAVAYLRANDGSAAKLAAQRQRIAAWAAKTETVIGSWHLEVGSGTAEMRHRPGLLKALAALELGGAQVLAVAHSEALTRGARQMVALVERVGRLGAEIQSAVEGSLTPNWAFFLFPGVGQATLRAERMNARVCRSASPVQSEDTETQALQAVTPALAVTTHRGCSE